MKKRLLVSVALVPLALVAFSSPASAQKPIPGIKATAPYKALKTYVNTLQAKRNEPTSAAKKSAYRTKLAAKRTKANTKVKALYNQRITRLSKQDDNKERREIKRIRQNQKNQVNALKASQASRIGQIQAQKNMALDRVDRRYAGKIMNLNNKIDRLQRQLSKTRNPAKRANLMRKIDAAEAQLRIVNDSKRDDVNAVVAKYDSRTDSVNDLFATRIAKVKASSQRQIKQAKNAWKSLFKEQLADTKERRTGEFQLVTGLRDRGAGYIQAMPPLSE